MSSITDYSVQRKQLAKLIGQLNPNQDFGLRPFEEVSRHCLERSKKALDNTTAPLSLTYEGKAALLIHLCSVVDASKRQPLLDAWSAIPALADLDYTRDMVVPHILEGRQVYEYVTLMSSRAKDLDGANLDVLPWLHDQGFRLVSDKSAPINLHLLAGRWPSPELFRPALLSKRTSAQKFWRQLIEGDSQVFIALDGKLMARLAQAIAIDPQHVETVLIRCAQNTNITPALLYIPEVESALTKLSELCLFNADAVRAQIEGTPRGDQMLSKMRGPLAIAESASLDQSTPPASAARRSGPRL